MHEQHPYRAAVPPVPAGAARPLWSVMIPTYHCATFLRETLASVLAQAPGPDVMQIAVVDDHSTRDDPGAVVAELGGGRVEFYRQPRNVGSIENFATCLRRARGRLVHLLHGDDLVRDGFYRRMGAAFEAAPEIGAAFCRHIYCDGEGHWESLSPLERPESGILPDWLATIAAGQRIATPAVVVRREVYERLGGFDRRIGCFGEDWEMWVRIAAHYPVWHEVEPLAIYRVNRAGSLSATSRRTGADIRDMRRATEIIGEYLPACLARSAPRRAGALYARWAFTSAREQLAARRFAAAGAQIREGVRCSPTPHTLGRLLVLLGWAGVSGLRLLASGRARARGGKRGRG